MGEDVDKSGKQDPGSGPGAGSTADRASEADETNGTAPGLSIQVRGVTKRFGPTVAVNDISFDVRKGEVVGFLGPNGSGKTTTMRLITSFYTPDRGRILIQGIDNQQRDVDTRRLIGYLPENNPLYGEMLVHEYLFFVANVRGMSRGEQRSSIDQAVEETGIAEIYNQPVSQCSKGYKQRVGIAGAILHRPEILIMDEPTEGLDPNQRVPIRELIKSMGRQRTVMLSTHVLQEVEETCDRLLIISRGRVVADGTVEQLRTQAHSKRYVDLEVEGDDVETALAEIPLIASVRRLTPVEGRQRFVLAVAEEGDIRPDLFRLAKRRGWTIWELHREAARLSDLFHSLTVESQE